MSTRANAESGTARTLIVVLVLFGIIGLGIVVALLARRNPPPESTSSGTVQIVASFYPLAEFARQVGGTGVDVLTLVPPGAEPHEYEPTPRDLATIRSADVFLFQGGGFDPWAERSASESRLALNVIDELARRGHLPNVNESGGDPHVWLNPSLAAEEVDLIANVLSRVDPSSAPDYERNRIAYREQLTRLDTMYRRGLASCAHRTFIFPHRAFHYLANEYSLEAVSLVGLSSEEEASPQRVAEVVRLARGKGITTIFFEPLEGPKVAETIAREIGGRVAPLNPIEGLTDDEQNAQKNYLSLMEENLSALQTVLQCQ